MEFDLATASRRAGHPAAIRAAHPMIEVQINNAGVYPAAQLSSKKHDPLVSNLSQTMEAPVLPPT